MPASIAALAAALSLAACTPASKSFELHSGALISCEEANQYVFESVVSMDMEVTAFKKARPGSPGHIKAVSNNPRNDRAGEVSIRCDPDGVHIDPKQTDLNLDKSFERGIFLGFTGRSGLVVDRGVIKGRRGSQAAAIDTRESAPPARSAAESAMGSAVDSAMGSTADSVSPTGASGQVVAGAAATAGAVWASGSGAEGTNNSARAGSPPSTEATGTRRPVAPLQAGRDYRATANTGHASAAKPRRGFSVELEAQRGFATVLDFEADVSAAGILPLAITVVNNSENTYEFDPADIVVRVRDSREKALSLTASRAVERLRRHGSTGGEDASTADIGDVEAAALIISHRQIGAARLGPGERTSGYIYYPVGDYDRATVRVIDVATGETEGFLVQF